MQRRAPTILSVRVTVTAKVEAVISEGGGDCSWSS
jgi:hypothetical protein